jgi:hypothetical protein
MDGTALEIPRYTELGKDTIVISYNDRLMRIATTKEITDIPLRAPLNINTIDTGVDRVQVSRFVYYNQSADSDEIRFLLN